MRLHEALARAAFACSLPLAAAPAVAAIHDTKPAAPVAETGSAKDEVASNEWPAEWPRGFKTKTFEYTLYQPQLESWDGSLLQARAAVGVRSLEGKDPTYGVVWFQARTQVDRIERVVTLEKQSVTKVKFPAELGDAAQLKADLQSVLGPLTELLALDELQEELKLTAAVQSGAGLTVRNDPPHFLFSGEPAILVNVDGVPVPRPVAGTDLARVINTNVLMLVDGTGTYFVHVFDGWMAAPALEGPWVVDTSSSDDLQAVLSGLAKGDPVDLLEGTGPHTDGTKDKAPSLSSKSAPTLVVATVPTELIVFEGGVEYEAIPGTSLRYAKNTTGNVFKDTKSGAVFVLASGRWFTAGSPAGPWTFVPATKLPATFASIPDDSPKENVKASVAGTEQATEALIANSIPQTAKVKLDAMQAGGPTYDGEPRLQPIEKTQLSYVVNSSVPVIRVSDKEFYCVDQGIWFQTSALAGPWTVASSVPASIYTIPTSSPIHYATYVYAYGIEDGTAYVGYTPGYYGTVVSDGVVVFGTGYVNPGWIGTQYYPSTPTYGYAADIVYTPVAGWAFGFGMGWAYGAATAGYPYGPYPCWGPYYGYRYPRGVAYGPRGGAAVWGPGGWAGTTGNIYHRWGATTGATRYSGGYNAWTGTGWRTESGVAYNSRTGRVTAGQHGVAANAYTGRWAAGAHGVVTNPYTGRSVAAGHVTVGNRAGESASGGYVRTEDGTAVRGPDGNVYADRDGHVYSVLPSGQTNRFEDGGWKRSGGIPAMEDGIPGTLLPAGGSSGRLYEDGGGRNVGRVLGGGGGAVVPDRVGPADRAGARFAGNSATRALRAGDGWGGHAARRSRR